ncbi:MAG: RidA family protein [Candidatus Eremiobacteraeota bacterium]|nr:RidA family protein [Candidatus Eremiobacteraeota bacterium]
MSAAVVANGLVFTAGQVDASAPDVAGQTRAILAKLDALLADAGTDKSHAVMANVWLADIEHFAEFNAVWDAWIDPQRPPGRATVESRLAGPQYAVEIALIAALPGETP